MSAHEKIDYVEFPAKDIEVTKAFLLQYSAGRSLTMGLTIRLSPMQGLMVDSSILSYPYRQLTGVP